MTDTLDFPPISEDLLTGQPARVSDEIRTAAGVLKQMTAPAPGMALATTDIKAVALSRFGDWRTPAAALVAKYKGVEFADTDTPKGLKALTDAIAEVRAPRYAAQNVSKDSKSELAQVSKAVGAEEAAIVAYLKPVEDALVAQKDAADAAKAEKKRVEDERIARERAEQQARLDKFAGWITAAKGRTSGEIAAGIAKLQAIAIDVSVWGSESNVGAGLTAKAEALRALTALRDEAQAAEERAAALEAQRLENERVAAELAAERRRLAEEEAERRRQREAEDAERARLQREADAAMEQKMRELRAMQEALKPAPEVKAEPVVEAAAVEPMPELEPELPPVVAETLVETPVEVPAQAEPEPAPAPVAVAAPADPLALLLAHIDALDDMKFPAHPKPSQEWFAELRRLAAEARP